MRPDDSDAEAAISPDMAIVDTHIHLWDMAGADYFAPAYLSDIAMSGHRVVSSVHVECGMRFRTDGEASLRPVGETAFILEQVEVSRGSDHDLAAGIVGWADLLLGERVRRTLDAHLEVGRGRFRGVRFRASWDAEAEIAYIGPEYPTSAAVFDEPRLIQGVRCLADLGLCLDIWVFHHQLADLTRFIARSPQLPIVINHVGGPVGVGRYAGRRHEVFAEWAAGLAPLAAFDNVFIKLDGVGIGRFGFGYGPGRRATSSDELVGLWGPYVKTCIDLFGPERCMFASNVPVDRNAASLAVYVNAFKKMLRGHSTSEQEAVFQKLRDASIASEPHRFGSDNNQNGRKDMSRFLMAMAAALTIVAAPVRAESVTIGVIAPLSGAGAAWGVALTEGVRFAIEDATRDGAIDIGGRPVKVNLVAYDDQYKASEALAAYNRLVTQDMAKYVIVLTSNATLAVKQSAQSDDVLVLTSAASNKAIDADTKHVIRLMSTPKDYVPGVVAWMKDNLRGNRVAIFNPNDETGWEITDVSVAAFEARGFTIVSKELYERSQKDFLPVLTRILATKPDVIELGGSSPATAGSIVRQARELGYTKSFSAFGGPGPREVVAAAGVQAAEGMVNILYADPANKGYQDLVARFKAKIGQPPNEFIVPCYDATRVLLQAIALSGEPANPNKVATAFSRVMPMKSLQGAPLSFGGRTTIGLDAQIMSPIFVGNIRNGEPVAVGVAK